MGEKRGTCQWFQVKLMYPVKDYSLSQILHYVEKQFFLHPKYLINQHFYELLRLKSAMFII